MIGSTRNLSEDDNTYDATVASPARKKYRIKKWYDWIDSVPGGPDIASENSPKPMEKKSAAAREHLSSLSKNVSALFSKAADKTGLTPMDRLGPQRFPMPLRMDIGPPYL